MNLTREILDKCRNRFSVTRAWGGRIAHVWRRCPDRLGFIPLCGAKLTKAVDSCVVGERLCKRCAEQLQKVRRTVTFDNLPLDIPPAVAKCPKCSAPLALDTVDEWTEEGEALSVSFLCVAERECDDEDWESFNRWHYSTPYIDWLPLDEAVLEWFSANYRYEG